MSGNLGMLAEQLAQLEKRLERIEATLRRQVIYSGTAPRPAHPLPPTVEIPAQPPPPPPIEVRTPIEDK